MKRIILILAMLLTFVITTKSQDKEPEQHTFRVNGVGDLDTGHINPAWHDCFQQK